MSIQAGDGDNICCDFGGVDGRIIELGQAMEALVKYDIAIPHLMLVSIKWVLLQPLKEFGQSALEVHESREPLRITARMYN